VKVGVFADTHSPVDEFVFASLILEYDQTLPLATPLVLDTSGTLMEYPYLIMAHLPGDSLLSCYEERRGTEPLDALRQVARVLARIHGLDIRCEGFGPPVLAHPAEVTSVRERGVLRGAYLDSIDYYRHGFERWLHAPGVRECLRIRDWDTLERVCRADPPKGLAVGVTHGDASIRNFLFSDDQLVGVIDGCGRIGWLEEDVAAATVFIWQHAQWLGHCGPVTLVNCFVAAYERYAQRPVSVDALRVLALRKLASRVRTCIAMGKTEAAQAASTMIPSLGDALGDDGDFLSLCPE